MKFNKKIKIGKYEISVRSQTFIIAEAGVNHNGDIKLAKQLVDVAVDSGADAVKFQTFKSENLILKSVKKALYQQKTTEMNETQFEMLKRLELNRKNFQELNAYCTKKNILFLTTAFDEESLEELNDFDLAAYKIASTDTTNLPFLRKIAKRGKPVILSTGMCYFEEVEKALQEIYPYNKDVILLQCTGNYPFNDEEANLNVINTYKNAFDMLIGYSDHSSGIGVSPYAVAMGAKVIEKHFTLDKSMVGPDHKASLNPDELKDFVHEIRKVEVYLGSYIKKPTYSEIKTRKSLQKCLVASKEIKIGELFTENNIGAKRTGGVGISPLYYKQFLGKKAKKSYNEDDVIKE